MPEPPSHEHNRRAWDTMARQKQRFTIPAPDEDFQNPLAKLDPVGWLGKSLAGKKLLCLAAGGGKHGPLYAAAGAEVTVVDISPAMLELDCQVAAERRIPLRTVLASMDDLRGLHPGEFDIVIHPVSTCYVPQIQLVYREVARVTRPGGLYISQHKQPTSLQASVEPTPIHYELLEPYYRTGPLPPAPECLHREQGTLEFLHRWEELLGGMCRAGFVIEDLTEPLHAKEEAAVGSFGHRSRFIPPYVRIKAKRVAAAAEATSSGSLWLPRE